MQPAWPGKVTLASVAPLVVALGIATFPLAALQTYAPPKGDSPAAAVEAIKTHDLRRVLNDRALGGYLIWRQVPVFIDGRAELYGEKFTMAYRDAVELKDVGQFLGLLREYDIDALLLQPGMPATGLLDQLGAWRRVYADDVAVLYVRSGS